MVNELCSVIIYGAGNFFHTFRGGDVAWRGVGAGTRRERSRVKLLSYNTPGFEHSAIIQMLIAILEPSASLSAQPAFAHTFLDSYSTPAFAKTCQIYSCLMHENCHVSDKQMTENVM